MDGQKNKNLISRGKRLAFLLRHDKNYQFDEHGWREISDLITSHGYTMDELKEIVETNNKQRYEFSEDMTRIRARQGHSVSAIQPLQWVPHIVSAVLSACQVPLTTGREASQ